MTKLTFLPGNNYPDLPHSQGGMKFATQISPLLNCKGFIVCLIKCFFQLNSCLIQLLTFILLCFIDEFLVVYYLALMNTNWKSLIEKDKGEQIVKSWEWEIKLECGNEMSSTNYFKS